jgi:hypothetical protein
MKRRLLAGATALALFAATASPASADPGSPGTTFPEQPGANLARGCVAVPANTGTGVANMSHEAFGIVIGLVRDACFEPQIGS